jgi:hypothetical protein
MQYPIKKIIEGRDSLLGIGERQTVREAMELMMENNFSQLPIINAGGKLIGIISEQSINQTCLHLGQKVGVFDLTVSHCCETVPTLNPDADLIQALDLIQNSAAIIVVEEDKPVATLTRYDLIQFFRDNSEGMIIIEDIEVTLRQLIDSNLPTQKDRSTAIENAFGYRQRKGRPLPEYLRLSFGEYVDLISDSKNWKRFSERFQSKEAFRLYMEQVRDIRNQMAHFRGRPTAMQENVLRRAHSWLESHTGPLTHSTTPVKQAEKSVDPAAVSRREPEASWSSILEDLFFDWRNRFAGEQQAQFGLGDLEQELGITVPKAAWEHRSWWNNDFDVNPNSRFWLREGFRVADMYANKDDDTVILFERDESVAMGLLFAELLQELKSRRTVTLDHIITKRNSVKFTIGTPGFYYGWAYGMKSALRVELLIDSGDYDFNKQAYDSLLGFRTAIDNKIGQSVDWQRIDGKNHCRIWSFHKMQFTGPIEQVEQGHEWAIETMLGYIEVLHPRVMELSLE